MQFFPHLKPHSAWLKLRSLLADDLSTARTAPYRLKRLSVSDLIPVCLKDGYDIFVKCLVEVFLLNTAEATLDITQRS